MVGHEPETLRGTQSQWEIEAGWDQTSPDRPRLWSATPRLPMPSKLPAYIQAALRKHPAALRHFEALAPSHRRRYLGWIESAKREETKLRRLKEAIRLLAAARCWD